MAFYQPSTDTITMPDEGRFGGTDTMTRDEGYMTVLAHELTHWSGGSTRLARDMGKRFGDQQYAAEELVAEFGAAMIAAELGIAAEPRPDHARYIAQYLKLLKNDPKAIFTAAAKAAQAVDYLKALSKPVEVERAGRRASARRLPLTPWPPLYNNSSHRVFGVGLTNK